MTHTRPPVAKDFGDSAGSPIVTAAGTVSRRFHQTVNARQSTRSPCSRTARISLGRRRCCSARKRMAEKSEGLSGGRADSIGRRPPPSNTGLCVVQPFSSLPFRPFNQTTVSRLRPLRRRERMTLRPPVVAMRARKPILRARFLRCGRNVGCMIFEEKEGHSCPSGWGVSRAGLASGNRGGGRHGKSRRAPKAFAGRQGGGFRRETLRPGARADYRSVQRPVGPGLRAGRCDAASPTGPGDWPLPLRCPRVRPGLFVAFRRDRGAA